MSCETRKDKMMEECMQHVKLATFFKCIDIFKDYPYTHLLWDEQTKTCPVYVMGSEAVSLIDGKKYPIFRKNILDRVDDICKVEIGVYQIHSLAPLPREYTLKQRQLLYCEAKKIHESCLESNKNKEKAYS